MKPHAWVKDPNTTSYDYWTFGSLDAGCYFSLQKVGQSYPWILYLQGLSINSLDGSWPEEYALKKAWQMVLEDLSKKEQALQQRVERELAEIRENIRLFEQATMEEGDYNDD